ncbi:MAG: hypothetical protein ACRDTG_22635 [Pseudonocardiaceae bacterium]
MTDIEDLRSRVDAIVSGPAVAQPVLASENLQSHFSQYDSEHMSRATALAASFMEIADAKGGEEGLADAVQEMERVLGAEIPGLVRHAVRLFLAHHKEAGEKLGGRSASP